MNPIHVIVEDAIQDKILAGAAVLSGNLTENIFDQGYGEVAPGSGFAMTGDTVIDIASVTKAAATVTALLILHDRGLIDFDAPFVEYLTGYRGELREMVSVRDLANHTSGFREVPGEGARRYFDESGPVMKQKLLELAPPFAPNRNESSYSCWNYLLLSMIVEAVGHRSFGAFCEQEIFRPLGMNDSSMGKVPGHIALSRLAQTPATDRPGVISDFVAKRMYRDGIEVGNAGMFSTAYDLAKLLRCYLRRGDCGNGVRLFGEKSFREVAPDRAKNYDGYRRFGWIVYDGFAADEWFGNALWHSGWSGQTIWMDVVGQTFGIVLTARSGDYDRAKKDRFEILKNLERING